MGLRPIYSPTSTALLSAKAARVPRPRLAGTERRDLVKDQVRVGWIDIFDYHFTRKPPLGSSLAIKQDMYDSVPSRQEEDTEEMKPLGRNSYCLT